MTQLRRIAKGSLVDTAIDSIRSAIEAGQWQVGERLPIEADLSDSLGISRNTVREAVRVLVHVGMLETRQGDGTYVRSSQDAGEILRRMEQAQLKDQLEVRQLLEAEAARLAAERRTDDEVMVMTRALDQRAAAGSDVAARIRFDEQFHHALVRATHNSALVELYSYFSHAITRTIERTELDASLPEPSQEDHEVLLAAVRRKDGARAKQLASALLQPSIDTLNATR